MHRFKAWVRAFFGFSRTETNAFLILLPLMLIILFSEPLYLQWRTRQQHDIDEHGLDSLMARLQWDKDDSVITTIKAPAAINFKAFDPNTVTEAELVRMGLSPLLSNRITRYRQKGGTFRKKEDLLKIYGFDSAWFRQAKQWMTIQRKIEIIKPTYAKERRVVITALIDINATDSLQLLTIYGIGPVLSKRICTFRDRLGGFVSLDQVKEVYGLDSLVVGQINKKFMVMENFHPKKLNLNRATLAELIKHPYMKRSEAQAILSFRLQHGNFQSAEQLTEIKSLTSDWIKKIQPYLVIE